MAVSRLRRALEPLLDSAPVLALRRLRYERQFRNWPGAFRGVYPDFEAAAASAPKDLPIGYDAPEMAALYLDLHQRVWPTDYPTMLWLQKLLPETRKLFDLSVRISMANTFDSLNAAVAAGIVLFQVAHWHTRNNG